jgi:predicted nucleic acid-binding protein
MSGLSPLWKRSQLDIFFDTTVLVAASEQSHPHYAQARPALLRVAAGQDEGFMGLHSIAEVFAALTLTRLPAQPRIHAVEAARIVTDNILPHFEVVPSGEEDYLEALNTMASGGWIGPKIYDVLLLRCAVRCAVERIYTFNLADFRQLAPAGLREKICAP